MLVGWLPVSPPACWTSYLDAFWVAQWSSLMSAHPICLSSFPRWNIFFVLDWKEWNNWCTRTPELYPIYRTKLLLIDCPLHSLHSICPHFCPGTITKPSLAQQMLVSRSWASRWQPWNAGREQVVSKWWYGLQSGGVSRSSLELAGHKSSAGCVGATEGIRVWGSCSTGAGGKLSRGAGLRRKAVCGGGCKVGEEALRMHVAGRVLRRSSHPHWGSWAAARDNGRTPSSCIASLEHSLQRRDAWGSSSKHHRADREGRISSWGHCDYWQGRWDANRSELWALQCNLIWSLFSAGSLTSCWS